VVEKPVADMTYLPPTLPEWDYIEDPTTQHIILFIDDMSERWPHPATPIRPTWHGERLCVCPETWLKQRISALKRLWHREVTRLLIRRQTPRRTLRALFRRTIRGNRLVDVWFTFPNHASHHRSCRQRPSANVEWDCQGPLQRKELWARRWRAFSTTCFRIFAPVGSLAPSAPPAALARPAPPTTTYEPLQRKPNGPLVGR